MNASTTRATAAIVVVVVVVFVYRKITSLDSKAAAWLYSNRCETVLFFDIRHVDGKADYLNTNITDSSQFKPPPPPKKAWIHFYLYYNNKKLQKTKRKKDKGVAKRIVIEKNPYNQDDDFV